MSDEELLARAEAAALRSLTLRGLMSPRTRACLVDDGKKDPDILDKTREVVQELEDAGRHPRRRLFDEWDSDDEMREETNPYEQPMPFLETSFERPEFSISKKSLSNDCLMSPSVSAFASSPKRFRRGQYHCTKSDNREDTMGFPYMERVVSPDIKYQDVDDKLCGDIFYNNSRLNGNEITNISSEDSFSVLKCIHCHENCNCSEADSKRSSEKFIFHGTFEGPSNKLRISPLNDTNFNSTSVKMSSAKLFQGVIRPNSPDSIVTKNESHSSKDSINMNIAYNFYSEIDNIPSSNIIFQDSSIEETARQMFSPNRRNNLKTYSGCSRNISATEKHRNSLIKVRKLFSCHSSIKQNKTLGEFSIDEVPHIASKSSSAIPSETARAIEQSSSVSVNKITFDSVYSELKVANSIYCEVSNKINKYTKEMVTTNPESDRIADHGSGFMEGDIIPSQHSFGGASLHLNDTNRNSFSPLLPNSSRLSSSGKEKSNILVSSVMGESGQESRSLPMHCLTPEFKLRSVSCPLLTEKSPSSPEVTTPSCRSHFSLMVDRCSPLAAPRSRAKSTVKPRTHRPVSRILKRLNM